VLGAKHDWQLDIKPKTQLLLYHYLYTVVRVCSFVVDTFTLHF